MQWDMGERCTQGGFSDVRQCLRQVGISMAAMAVVAIAMAAKGWHAPSLALGTMIILMAALTMLQVRRVLRGAKLQAVDYRRAAHQAEEHYVKVLQRVIDVSEARERFGQGRSERIGALCEQMGRELKLSESKCRLLSIAGRLHDIGLLAVPRDVLDKASSLDREEFRIVKKHSEVSYEVLKPLQCLEGVLPAIRFHHERMNGTGYPSGLVGQSIPLEARIVAVADAYDAMTHDRPYRAALSPLQAMEELQRCSPEGYDRECVDALTKIMNFEVLSRAVRPAEASLVERATANS
jgi:HD-GYP domain-containing protein (c-di-GMP phosphodiesterase class II)